MTATLRQPAARSAELREIAASRVAASNLASDRFFSESADRIAAACQAMARRFQRGGRLLVAGGATQQSDVSHAVVEFLHPVIVGKRSLPAIALPNGLAPLLTLGRSADILLVVAGMERTPHEQQMLGAARDQGMLTLVLSGEGELGPADFCFRVPSRDSCVVQETHEMLYHILWELIHVFLDHRLVRT